MNNIVVREKVCKTSKCWTRKTLLLKNKIHYKYNSSFCVFFRPINNTIQIWSKERRQLALKTKKKKRSIRPNAGDQHAAV